MSNQLFVNLVYDTKLMIMYQDLLLTVYIIYLSFIAMQYLHLNYNYLWLSAFLFHKASRTICEKDLTVETGLIGVIDRRNASAEYYKRQFHLTIRQLSLDLLIIN